MNQPVIGTLHGWAMHSGLFEDLTTAWPDADWRGIDLPGHGRRRGESWPDDPDALVDNALADLPEGSWLLGWSMGGLVALQAVLRHRQRFAGLILIAATPCFVARPHWPDGTDAGLVKAMALELASDPEVVVQRFLALEIHGSARARDGLRRLKALTLRHGLPDKVALLAGLSYLEQTDISDRLPDIDCPVLLVGGRRDKLVPWASLERSHRMLSDSRLVRIPGAAHAPFLTDSGAVARAVKGFVTDV